jgi:hypothetical protein
MRKLIVSTIILLPILLVLITYYPNFSFFYLIKSRYSASKTPWAYILPIDRTVERLINSSSNSQTFYYENLKFNVPWKKLEVNKKIENGLLLSSLGEQNKGFFVNRINDSVIKIGKRLVEENPADAPMIKMFFGKKVFNSGFAFYDKCLSTSPNKISIFTPKRQLGETLILLMLKTIITRQDVKIFRFQTINLKGFQFGDPEANDGVEVEFFIGKDDTYLMKFISVNQNEIDYILSSIEEKIIER